MAQQPLSSPKLSVLDKLLSNIQNAIYTDDATQEQFNLTKTDPLLLSIVQYVEELPLHINLEEDRIRHTFNNVFIDYGSKLLRCECGGLQELLLEALIERGLNINYVDIYEKTILDYAFEILEFEENYEYEGGHHTINEWIEALQKCGAKKAEDISFTKSANKV